MAVIRYKARPISPVDAAMWNGTNITDIQAVCPQVQIPEHGTMLIIPTDLGPAEVYVGDVVMRAVGTDRFTKLDADVFDGLYMPQ